MMIGFSLRRLQRREQSGERHEVVERRGEGDQNDMEGLQYDVT